MNVCLVQPHTTQVIDGEIMRESTRENYAANAAGRRACYPVDDDPQIEGLPDRSEERKIGILGVMRSPVIAICGFVALVFSLFRLRERMIRL